MPLVWDLPGEDPTRPAPTPQQPEVLAGGSSSAPPPPLAGKVVWDLPGPNPLEAPAAEAPGLLDQASALGGFALETLANPASVGAKIIANPREAGALTARIAPPMVGAGLGGPLGGAAGGALGEAIAQLIEGRELSPLEVGIGGVGGAVGFPRALTAGKALLPTLGIRGAEGAVFSAADEAARMWARGEALDPTQIAGAGLAGAPIGAVVGGGIETAARSGTLRDILAARALSQQPEALPAAAAAAVPQGQPFKLPGQLVDDIGFGTPLAEMRPAPAAAAPPLFAPQAGAPEPAVYGPPPRAQEPQVAPAAVGQGPGLAPPPVRSGAPEVAAYPAAEPLVTRDVAQGAASPESGPRLEAEQAQGVTYERVNLRSGKRTPEPATVDRVDLGTIRLNPNEVIVRRAPGQPLDIFAQADNVSRQQLERFRAQEAGRPTRLADLQRAPRETPGEVVPEAPAGLAPDENVGRMPLADILVDEQRFQTRVRGTTRRLADVGAQQISDPSLGNLGVWRDPADGKVYVVEGHHRRQMLEGAGRPDARVQFLDAANAQEARLEGALMNMRAGTFDAMDVAGVLRESGWTRPELEAQGVELTRGQMRDGLALANLHPALWGMAMRDEMPLSRAATIGRELGGTPEAQAQQLALVEMLGKRRGELTDTEVAEVIRQTKAAPTTTETQTTLFGTEEMARSLAVERAQVIAGARAELAKDRRLFGFVGQEARAARLREEGTEVDTGRAQAIATESAQVGELFDRLANRQGPVAEVVNAAARAAAAGEPVAEVVRRSLPDIRAAVAAELAPAAGGPRLAGEEGQGAAAAPPAVPEGQQGLGFGPLKNERGAVELPNPRELLKKGRAYVARLEAEQAEIAERELARSLEAQRRRGSGRLPGTAKAPPTLEERTHGRPFPQEAGDLQSPGRGTRDPDRLPPSVGEAFGPEVEEILTEMGLNQRADVEFARRGVVSDVEMQRRGDELAAEWIARADADPAAVGKIRDRGEAVSAEKATAILTVNRHYLEDFLARMQKAGPEDAMEQLRAIRQGLAGRETLTALPGAHATAGALRSVDAMLQAAGAAAESGRSLRAFGVFKRSQQTPQAEALRIAAKLFNTNPETARARLAEFQLRASQLRPDDVIALNHLLASIDGRHFSDTLYRYAIGGWLSGPPGILIDGLSNGLMMMRKPLETAAAVPFERLRARATGTPQELFLGQAAANVVGMYFGVPEAMRRFMRAVVTQVPQSGRSRFFEPGRPLPQRGVIGRGVSVFPTIRMAIDEAFKSLNEMSTLYGRAYQIPMTEGLRGAEHVRAMSDILRHPERVHGLLEEMADQAAYRTWQRNDAFTNSLLSLKANYPGVRWVFPFIRTPLALFRQGMKDVLQPLQTTRQLIGTMMKAAGKGGPVQERYLSELPRGAALSEQLTRTVVGSMLAGAIMTYALQGKITGAGPVSAEKRRELRATGWAQNAIITEDNAVSYNRLDPVGLYVGTIADLSQAVNIAYMEEEDAAIKIATLFATSAGNNFVNKTYMRGLSDLLEAVRDPERYLPSFLSHEVASLVPYSVLTSRLAKAGDPTVRQGRTLSDVLQTRIPGLTSNVFPLRDVFGREILIPGGFAERLLSPFDRSTIQNDPATKELRRLEYAPGSPMRSLQVIGVGTDLTPEEYDTYVREAGTLAYKTVSRLVETEGYKDLPDNSAGDNLRRKLIGKAFTRAREAGRAKILPSIKPRVTAELELERTLLGLDIQGPETEEE